MSYSTLFKIDKDYKKQSEIEYHNSWLFSPIVFDELFWKYMPEKSMRYDIMEGKMVKQSLMSAGMFGGNDLWSKLNSIINSCNNLNDRILWELSQQQCFEKKDFKVVSDAIIYGIEEYISPEGKEYGEHISNRWIEMAEDIKSCELSYIIHKNSSCDDEIEILFHKYNEDEDEYEDCSMSESEYNNRQEFVMIKDGKISFQLIADRFKVTSE